MESKILAFPIDTKEGRDVATADVIGAYLLADIKDHVIIKLSGKIVEIMCKVNSKYKECIAH